MKILFFTENFPPETNAAATRVYERACYWVRWGHQVTVVTCAPNFPVGRVFPGYENSWYQVEEMSGIRVVRVKTFIAPNKGVIKRALDFLSYLVTGLPAGMIQEKPDVVTSTSPQFFAAVAGWLLGATRGVPFVFELGDLWPASIHAVGVMRKNMALKLMEKLELHLYRKSAAVVALTSAFKENLMRRGIDGNKIAVVINGVELDRYEPRERDAELSAEWDLDGCFVVGYVGTHGMAHGLRNVLDTAELLLDVKDLRFMLVGSGAEREVLIEEAHARRLSNVVFIPPQKKENMPAIWSLCDVALVHLKGSELFAGVIPSKIFEAMGMGLPLILASPEGEASRILQGDKAGAWAPAEEPEALAQAVMKMKDNQHHRTQCAANSLKAAPNHSREHQAKEMIRVLEMVAEGRRGEIGAVGAA